MKREQKAPESIIAAGNPAKEIKDVTERERDFWDWGRKIYRGPAQKYCDMGMERVEISPG